MTLAPWLNPPDFLSAIRAGAGVGLQARAQDIQEQQHADQLGLSREELQARREQHAAALAESLRQHNAMEMYRQQEVAHQKVLEGQAASQLLATMGQRQQQQSNFEKQQAVRESAEKRLQNDATARKNFRPGSPLEIKHPKTGETVGLLQQESPQTWRMVRPQPRGQQDLTPNARMSAALRLGNPNADLSNPYFQQAAEMLNPPKPAPAGSEAVPGDVRKLLESGEGLPDDADLGTEATATGGRVSVKSQDGKVGTIPKSQLDQALKAGYSLIDDAAD